MRKILLNKSISKESVNTDTSIPIQIDRDVALYHDEIKTDKIDILQVYNNEKDACNKHRFIFTIYPICTNVLYNHLTEVIYKEGSSETKMLANNSSNQVPITGAISTESPTRKQVIRNTEYSNDFFEFTYHCGADIFNNHLLRSKEDTSVQKRSTNASKRKCAVYSGESNTSYATIDAFNTIGDFYRDSAGELIEMNYPNSSNDYTFQSPRKGNMPLYMFDTIYSFSDSFANGLKRKDGWIGFYNPTTFRMPVGIRNGEKYYVNKCMNNKEGCEFIEMCPERDLFSFTPKKNPYRKRIEYNWDYFLTYPAESEYNDGIVLIGKGKGLPLEKVRDYDSSNGMRNTMFRCPVKHNLNIGDHINLKFTKGENIKCTITGVGTSNKKYADRYFSVRCSDYEIVSAGSTPERFAKVENNFECEYYFRKFKKFDNDFRNTINRLAFANTIYGDEVNQIVFTDDINIEEYKDNRGRPLSEIYLTILKANRGWKEWYNQNNTKSPNVEYSHVFGKVTSGLDVPSYVGINFPSIRKQHNVDLTKKPADIEINESSVFLEGKNVDGITKKMDSFYGDLVEFNPITVNETILEVVKHRFNTAQRETFNENYTTIFYDEIAGDNYDADRYGTSSVSGNTRIREWKLNEGFANISPEGYVYIPHHRIKIGEFSDTVRQLSDTLMDITESTQVGKEMSFKTAVNYGLVAYDIVALLDKNTKERYKFRVDSYIKENNVYECKMTLIDDSNVPTDKSNANYWYFKHNLEVPDYAYMLPDGTGRHIWRDKVNPSSLSFMSDLYNIPFTNGAFYHHVNITFPVKRQDPFHNYGLVLKKDDVQIDNNFDIPSTEVDTSVDEFIPEIDNTTCF